jgi:cytochrome c biogenesis protein
MKGTWMSASSTSAGPLHGLYKWFSSVTLTIILLSVLAVTSIIGTLIPQNQTPEVYFRAYGEFFFRIFSALKIFDMYHSWWFQILLVLLTLNIVTCSIDRLPGVWKVIFNVRSRFKSSRFINKPGNVEFLSEKPVQEMQSAAEALVSKTYGHTQVTPTKKGVMIFGEKWRWSRLGVYIVHSSVVLLLAGSVIGSIFGFDGFVQIPEGETVDMIRLRNTGAIHKLPFKIRCDDFDVSFYKNGAPKEFRSDLVILENDQEVIKKRIIVNDPLRYAGINFFQSSYGQMADERLSHEAIEAPEEILLSLMIQDTGMTYQQKTRIGKSFDLPEGTGKFVLTEFKQKATFMGQAIGEALVGILTPKDGQPVEVTLPLRFANFDKMRKGKVIISVLEPNANETKHDHNQEIRYYTGLEVTRDPGVWVVYTGFIFMLIGCFVTFFMSHQQAFIEITAKGKKSHVVVAGTAYRNQMAMQRRVKQLSIKLGAEPERPE